MSVNPEAAERERLRRDAQGGACPICGRSEARVLERQVDSYARGNTALMVDAERRVRAAYERGVADGRGA